MILVSSSLERHEGSLSRMRQHLCNTFRLCLPLTLPLHTPGAARSSTPTPGTGRCTFPVDVPRLP
jgi:hypothetical protein